MSFFEIYIQGFVIIMILMTFLWIVSVIKTNASIVDPFWGFAYVLATIWYYLQTNGTDSRTLLILILVVVWGMRLSIFLGLRNAGKGEDFRYKQFRKDYGEKHYWWVSFFQVFLLQGVLAWLISSPLLAAMYYSNSEPLGIIDFIALAIWIIGFVFEAGGDWQMARFKANPENSGKVLNKGFWKYTRHPNYFGDAAVWWGFGLFGIAAGSYVTFLSSILMTFLLLRVSGVSLLEKSLKDKKPEYKAYIKKTSAFLPWFPKKIMYAVYQRAYLVNFIRYLGITVNVLPKQVSKNCLSNRSLDNQFKTCILERDKSTFWKYVFGK